MKHIFFVGLLIIAVVISGGASAPRSEAANEGQDAPLAKAAERAVPGQYIVVLKAGANPRSVAAISGVNPQHVYTAALNGFSATLNPGQLTALLHNPNVDYIEEDQEVSINGVTSWGLDRIDQTNLPLDSSYNPGSHDGTGVTAYIIDTGIYFTHQEFGTTNLGQAPSRAVNGTDKVTTGGSGVDCNGHGTHVAGTVGGLTFGVARNANLVGVRVLDCNGKGTWANIIAGVDWVTSDHKPATPAVANMSLTGSASTAVDTAVKNSISSGVSYVLAAGNGNIAGIAQDACKISPARVPEAMTIGATDSMDKKASWSNYGNCVDWFAPGVNIPSAYIGSPPADRWWATLSGTSMAAPHTTGVAAIYLQGLPSAQPADVRTALFNKATPNKVTSSKTTNNKLLNCGPVNTAAPYCVAP
jgi:subtilisin family serine protease